MCWRVSIYFIPTSEYSEICSVYLRDRGFGEAEQGEIVLGLLREAITESRDKRRLNRDAQIAYNRI